MFMENSDFKYDLIEPGEDRDTQTAVIRKSMKPMLHVKSSLKSYVNPRRIARPATAATGDPLDVPLGRGQLGGLSNKITADAVSYSKQTRLSHQYFNTPAKIGKHFRMQSAASIPALQEGQPDEGRDMPRRAGTALGSAQGGNYGRFKVPETNQISSRQRNSANQEIAYAAANTDIPKYLDHPGKPNLHLTENSNHEKTYENLGQPVDTSKMDRLPPPLDASKKTAHHSLSQYLTQSQIDLSQSVLTKQGTIHARALHHSGGKYRYKSGAGSRINQNALHQPAHSFYGEQSSFVGS